MARFDQDPDALSILLRGQPQIPQMSEEDYELESMIPEEQLFQAQEALGQRGAASGGAYAIPSREALKQGGMAELRKLFGIQQAEGRAKAYPSQVAGEYGLQEARIKGGYDVESARQKAEADAAQQGRNQQFQQEQQGRQQTFTGGQGELNRAAIERNTAANIAGRQNDAEEATRRALANQAAITARTKPKGIWESIFGGPDPAAAPATAPVSPAVAATVAQLRQNPQAAGLTFEQLLQQGVSGTPEELAELQQAWGR